MTEFQGDPPRATPTLEAYYEISFNERPLSYILLDKLHVPLYYIYHAKNTWDTAEHRLFEVNFMYILTCTCTRPCSEKHRVMSKG